MKQRRAVISVTAMVGLQPARGGGTPDDRRDAPARQIDPRPGGSHPHLLQAKTPAGPNRLPGSRLPDTPNQNTDPASTAQSP